jgi:hypothetical protein
MYGQAYEACPFLFYLPLPPNERTAVLARMTARKVYFAACQSSVIIQLPLMARKTVHA